MIDGLDLNQIMKQAQEMQKKMQEKKAKAKNVMHQVSVGGGMIELEISEDCEIKKIKVAQELLKKDELSTLEELLKIAFNEAIRKVKKEAPPDLEQVMSMAQQFFPNKK